MSADESANALEPPEARFPSSASSPTRKPSTDGLQRQNPSSRLCTTEDHGILSAIRPDPSSLVQSSPALEHGLAMTSLTSSPANASSFVEWHPARTRYQEEFSYDSIGLDLPNLDSLPRFISASRSSTPGILPAQSTYRTQAQPEIHDEADSKLLWNNFSAARADKTHPQHRGFDSNRTNKPTRPPLSQSAQNRSLPSIPNVSNSNSTRLPAKVLVEKTRPKTVVKSNVESISLPARWSWDSDESGDTIYICNAIAQWQIQSKIHPNSPFFIDLPLRKLEAPIGPLPAQYTGIVYHDGKVRYLKALRTLADSRSFQEYFEEHCVDIDPRTQEQSRTMKIWPENQQFSVFQSRDNISSSFAVSHARLAQVVPVPMRPMQTVSSLESQVVSTGETLQNELTSPVSTLHSTIVLDAQSDSRTADNTSSEVRVERSSGAKGKSRAITPCSNDTESPSAFTASDNEDVIPDADDATNNGIELALASSDSKSQALLNLHITTEARVASTTPKEETESASPASSTTMSPNPPEPQQTPKKIEKISSPPTLSETQLQPPQEATSVQAPARRPTPAYLQREDVRIYLNRIKDWACACEACWVLLPPGTDFCLCKQPAWPLVPEMYFIFEELYGKIVLEFMLRRWKAAIMEPKSWKDIMKEKPMVGSWADEEED